MATAKQRLNEALKAPAQVAGTIAACHFKGQPLAGRLALMPLDSD